MPRLVPIRFVVLAALALAVAGAGGCGGAQAADGGEPEDVDEALLEELRAVASIAADLPYQRVRYNPAAEACACPAFEVRVGEDWWRVTLEPADAEAEDLPRLRAEAIDGSAEGRVWYVVGRLDDDPIVACPNGCFGFEMTVVSVSDEPPPLVEPPAPDADEGPSP